MPKRHASFGAAAIPLLIAVVLFTRGTPPAGAVDQEKPLAIAIEEKRAEVKQHQASVEKLRESFRTWKRSVLEDQQIVTRQAESRYQNAKLTRQVAEIALIEYEQGTYLMERQKADGEIGLAKTILALAQKENPQQDPRIHQLELEQAEVKLQSAEISLEVLEKFTKPRRLQDLRNQMEIARVNERYAEGTLNLELTRERKLEHDNQVLHTPAPEEKMLALLRDSISLEEKLKGVLEEVKALEVKVKQEPKDVEALTTDLRQKQAEAANLSGKALRQLDEALFWGDAAITKRKELIKAVEKLRKAEEELDALEAKARAK